MELPSYFTDFLSEIRPKEYERSNLKKGHQKLKELLLADPVLSPVIVSVFLQGSYRRLTAITLLSGKKSDVDVIVVTKLSELDNTPQQALNKFRPFLDKHYPGQYQIQNRSIGIVEEKLGIELDLVITSAPSESELNILQNLPDQDLEEEKVDSPSFGLQRLDSSEVPIWKLSPLRIPDRVAKVWEPTHPLQQIQWTWEKNSNTSKHYINVVKALKWWRRVNYTEPKYPKGYPLEHLIGQCCPDEITSVAKGVTLTLEKIANDYSLYAQLKRTPQLMDHGVSHDVMKRISGKDFALFYEQVWEAAKIARQAMEATTAVESARLWRILFGDKFPAAPEGEGANGKLSVPGGFTPRTGPSGVDKGRFA